MKTFINADSTLIIDDIHSQFECKDKSLIESLVHRTSIVVGEEIGADIDDISKIHLHIQNSDINQIRMRLFKYFNSSDFDWAQITDSLAGDKIREYVGPDYCIQTKVNVSMQMPNDETSVLPVHSDCVSGDSPWQLNMWIPLTRAHATASMFLISAEESLRYFDITSACKHTNAGVKNRYNEAKGFLESLGKYYIDARPGEVLIFHPGVLHGNDTNTTDITRISLNIRFKSLYAPDGNKNSQDRRFGIYYKVAATSRHTEISRRIAEALAHIS